MVQPHPVPAPPGEPAWDIAFTRLTLAVRPQVDACVLELTRRFQAIGLGCDAQSRQTPRGLATFLAVVGQRGLLFIVDITLIDGMAVDRGPCAALDIRLLDACGDVTGRAGRVLALTGALVAGVVLAIVVIPDFGAWLHASNLFHHSG